MKKIRAVMRYHGGKHKLAEWMISHFPPHRVYVEPFGGGASVLMQKGRAYSEVYNDLDGEIVNVFRVLRDPESAARLQEVCELTPYARDEFTAAYDYAASPVERARQTLFRANAGFGTAGSNAEYATGFRSGVFRSGTTPAEDWMTYTRHIAKFTARLRGVVIENLDALEILEKYDSPETLFYCDPPYVQSTRTASMRQDQYRHEMDDAAHESLADWLHRVKGKVFVSGYRCPLYERLYADWRRMDRKVRADKAALRVESVWMSPNAESPQIGLMEV